MRDPLTALQGLRSGLLTSAAQSGGAPAPSLAATFTVASVTPAEDQHFTYWRVTEADTYTVTCTKAGYVQVEIGGGGGSGGSDGPGTTGGGAGGQVARKYQHFLSEGTHTIVVGAGGIPNGTKGASTPATDTTFAGLTARYGGNGADGQSGVVSAYNTGGRAGAFSNILPPADGGNDGGTTDGDGATKGSGGGASDTSDGGNGVGIDAGDGAAPVMSSFANVLASPLGYGGGGGGAAVLPGTRGSGNDAGGDGATINASGAQVADRTNIDAQTPSSGGGGVAIRGQGSYSRLGGNGADGFATLRVPKNDVFGAVPDEPPFAGYVTGMNADTGLATIAVSGTVIAPASATVEARLVDGSGVQVAPWAAMTRSDATFSGSFALAPRADRLHIQSRIVGDTYSVATTAGHMFAGLVIVDQGQSNRVYLLQMTIAPSGQFTNAMHPDCVVVNASPNEDTAPRFGLTSDLGMTVLVNELQDRTGLPVMVIHAALSATPINLFRDDAANPTIWPALAEVLDDLQVNTITAFTWHQGESNTGTLNLPQYQTDLLRLRTQMLADTGQAVADVPMIAPTITRTTATLQPANWEDMRQMQIEQTPLQANAHVIDYHGTTMVYDSPDGYVHYISAAYQERSRQEAIKLAEVLGYATGPAQEFGIASATRISATQIRVTVAHGRGDDFELVEVVDDVNDGVTPRGGSQTVVSTLTEYFRVATNAAGTSTLAVSAIARETATTILITHASQTVTDTLYLTVFPADGVAEYIRDNSEGRFNLRSVFNMAVTE